MPGPPGLRPLKREPAAIAIANLLTEAVMNGTLEPGRQLGEVELARRLGVSRGPLREAMQRLVQQGILRSEPHRGVFVASLTDEDVRDIYLARTAIETAACRLVLRDRPRRTADIMARAHRAMADAAASGDRAALAAADMELHQILVAESGSTRLQRMAATLFVETRMCLSALTERYSAPIGLVDEHAAIIEALRAGDEELLIGLLDEHMKDAVRRLAPEAPGHPAGPAAPAGPAGPVGAAVAADVVRSVDVLGGRDPAGVAAAVEAADLVRGPDLVEAPDAGRGPDPVDVQPV